MADFIKKFLEKKKQEAKFKKAGPGHKLTESNKREEQSKGLESVERNEPCPDARKAGIAALARFEASTSAACVPSFSMAHAELKNQIRREIEMEKRSLKSDVPSEPKVVRAVAGVFFRCPTIDLEVLPKEEWRAKIRAYLYEGLEEERGLTSCLIIRSCNRNKEKVEQCIATLSTYLENIITHPNEPKYQRIRISNKIFQDKVVKLEGSLDFLLAAGFENKILEVNGNNEEFLVYIPEKSNEENLQMLLDALTNSEPIRIELDRNLQVLHPSQATVNVELTDDFFDLTPQEIKREQQLRSERLENSLQLKTKAMREKEEFREMKKYRFAVIRVRFPDGIFLQGTFGVYEKLKVVKEFIEENLLENGKYILSTGLGHQLDEADEDTSLMELRLVPATVLIFAWDLGSDKNTFLKPEILMRAQNPHIA